MGKYLDITHQVSSKSHHGFLKTSGGIQAGVILNKPFCQLVQTSPANWFWARQRSKKGEIKPSNYSVLLHFRIINFSFLFSIVATVDTAGTAANPGDKLETSDKNEALDKVVAAELDKQKDDSSASENGE